MNLIATILVTVLLLPAVCFAGEGANAQNAEELFGWTDAANRYQVPVELLKAISYVESRWNPDAVNTANYNDSEDHGHMQINSIWRDSLPKGGWEFMHNARYCTNVGAWILKQCLLRNNNDIWAAVSAYHTNHSLEDLKQRAAVGDEKAKERYERAVQYVAKVQDAMEQIVSNKVSPTRPVYTAEFGGGVGDSAYYGENDKPLKR